MKRVYRYFQDYGRMGSLEGLFIAEDTDKEWFWGRSTYDYDVLGKHSEIEVVFDEETVEEIPAPSEVIAWLEQNIGKDISGTTPWEYKDQLEEAAEEYDEEE